MNPIPARVADPASPPPAPSERDLKVKAAWQLLIDLLAAEVARMLEEESPRGPKTA